jgi:hypothetical protein
MNARSVSFGAVFVLLVAVSALADPARDAIVAALTEEAKKQDAGFAGFSAERGQAFWAVKHSGGKPDTPSCTSCHGSDPTQAGQTRAGKAIEPMAVSKTPKRLTDPAEVNKWFTRNCNSVLGRECTAVEKGDVIAYLSSK